jgi:hypothetical protein
MKHYCLTGRRNHGRPLKRLLDTSDRNGSTSGPAACQIYDGDYDDDDDDDDDDSVGNAASQFDDKNYRLSLHNFEIKDEYSM